MKRVEPAPPLIGRLWLLAALTVALLPHLTRMPLWMVPLCLGVLTWRLGSDLRGWPLPGTAVRLLLTFIAVVAIFAGFRTLAGRDAGLALLSVMVCLKLTELRTLRDAMLVVFLGYFLVAGSFLFSQSIGVGLYLVVVVLLLTAALVALNHPAAEATFGRAYLGRALALLVQALPIMVVLFVLFPRIAGPLWGLPKDAFAGKTGLSDHMTLQNITDLALSEAVAFRVAFEGPVPPADELYWRGPVLWFSDGRRWDAVQKSAAPRWFWQPGRFIPLGEPVSYTVTMEPNNDPWVLALDLPAPPYSGLVATGDFQLRLPRKLAQRQRFALRSYTQYRATELPPGERILGLQLPRDTNPRSRMLAATWRGLPPATIVATALRYFRDQPFYYTRHPPPLAADAIDGFLFDTRRGFCEHYAAAFTTLMRAAGVPARIVTGYQGGEANPLAAYLIVRQSMAHAWSEVYLPERGWTRVDPTAVIPADRVETEVDIERFRGVDIEPAAVGEMAWLAHSWRRLRYTWDAVNNGWNQWVLGYDQQRQLKLLEKLGLMRFGWNGAVGVLAAIIALLVTVISGVMMLRGRPSMEPAVALYRRFCGRLARLGLPRDDDEGPQTFADRIARVRPDLATTATAITSLYVDIRYGHRNDREALAQLRRQVTRFRPKRGG